jgi:hypothetical protein
VCSSILASFVNQINRKIVLLIATVGATYVATAALILYFLYSFFSAFSPTKVSISESSISSSVSLINPIYIERIRVDSIGEQGYPVRYQIEYITVCSITQVGGKPPKGVREISLKSPGRYTWKEGIVNSPALHEGIHRSVSDTIYNTIWSESTNLNVCPLTFERNNWYFIKFGDPTLVGTYIHLDNDGKMHQFNVYSGVSPI